MSEYRLDVSFNISDSSITGTSLISLKKDQELSINLGSLKIIYIMINNRLLHPDLYGTVLKLTSGEDGILEIRYKGSFKPSQSPDPENLYAVQNVIDERGVSLTGLWYPAIDGLNRYRLTVTLPKGYEAVSEAEDIEKVISDKSVKFYFYFDHPVESINLAASDRFIIKKDYFKDIEIGAYFHKEDIGLAEKYIEYTKKYLRIYEDIAGEYPYRNFRIVENFLPTGYSMPTFTLIGSTVVRLPFIVETSLGHEILHQWFGNSVLTDYEKGNWAEGLTTYLADHLYKEEEGRGWEYRKQILTDYQNYVNEGNEFSLMNFTGRVDNSSKAIGYGKSAMVFHMLKNKVGEEIFDRSLKDFIKENSFSRATWADLRISFEKHFEGDLTVFFRQWVERKDLPSIDLSDADVRYADGAYELSFTLNQGEPIYTLDIPVTIYSGDVVRKSFFRLKQEKKTFKVFLSSRPDRIIVDEDYDIARRINRKEKPAVIGGLLGDKDLIIVFPEQKKDKYKTIIGSFKEKGAVIKDAAEITDSEIKASSVVILGYDNSLIRRLYGKSKIHETGFSVIIKANPFNPDKVIGIFNGESESEVKAGFRKITHYGKYSSLFFEDGRNTGKETEETERGIGMNLKDDAEAVDLSALSSLSKVIENVSSKKIIYVGEFHDVFSHHAVQFDIIQEVYKRNRKIAIGMEMFQRPFQKTIDAYMSGRINEKEFLKKTEYFKRWRFDYNLYKPILDFALSNSIPVVALNMEREIIDKVSEDGIRSLSEEEMKSVPDEMDFSDESYRKRISRVFRMHKDWEEKNFDYFFQSQILWDETMSESITRFLKSNPDYQMIVIAGQGHLEYGSGIPLRTFRRNRHDYAIVLIDAAIENDIADYVIFPKYVEGITSPKLMVFLNVEDERLEVTGFPNLSVSEEAGLKAGDIIIKMDGKSVDSIEDLKIQLFYRQKGDVVTLTVLRKIKDKERKLGFKVIL